MMNRFHSIFLLLSIFCSIANAQKITRKVVEGPIDRDDSYWVIEVEDYVNRPNFPAFIRFYNEHTAKSEYEIDCSTSGNVMYHFNQLIFLTKDHLWSEGDSYYITIDEGALYSDNTKNSSSYLDPGHWKFNVVAPRFAPNSS